MDITTTTVEHGDYGYTLTLDHGSHHVRAEGTRRSDGYRPTPYEGRLAQGAIVEHHRQSPYWPAGLSAAASEALVRAIEPRDPTAYECRVPWRDIHAAALAVDDARAAVDGPRLGALPHGVGDAWGGSYWGWRYEARGLAGLVAVYEGACTIRRAAWEAIHRARYATPTLVRSAIETTLALHPLMVMLASAGVCQYDGASVICGQGPDGILAVTGLRWLAGEQFEDRPVTVAHARAYLAGGVTALREALGHETPPRRNL